jgi:hypothetical protein
MIDAGSANVQRTAARAPAAQMGIVRRISLGMMVALLVQYVLGMVVNLYVTVPARDHGGGIFTAIGRAFANGPAALASHAGLGLLIVAGTISLVVRSVLSRRRALIWLSAVTLLAVLGAAVNGAAFVDSGSNGPSLGMAILTGVALLCLALSLYLSGAPGTAPPAVRGTAGQDGTGQDVAR